MSSRDESGSPNRREEGSNAGCLALQSGEEVTTMDDEEMEKRIIAALEDKPLCSEDLLCRLGIEPGGGEAGPAIWNLLVQGIMRRRETFVYELKREIKEEDIQDENS